MELLDQKGADLLGGAVRESSRVAVSDQSASVPSARAENVVTALAVASAVVGVYLLFRDLALTGLTWDEWMDYEIARDYVLHKSFLTDLDDPSQARLSHLVAAGSFALLGDSYRAFKLPFAVIGMVGGLALWSFLASMVRPAVAAMAAAMYFTCPYVLAASRTGATAGDALVMVTTLGFVITLYRWIQTNRFWPYGAACGVVCGLAIGAKWTSAVLLGAVGLAWLLDGLRNRRRFFDGPVWVALLAHQWIAVGLAFFASPTLMLGVVFVQNALSHSLKFTGMALLQFGEMRAEAPWYYIPAVLISKYAIAQLFVFCFELGIIVLFWAQKKKKVGPLPLVCLLSMLPMVPLATKGFQNAHYYVATVPSVMILSALALERWLRAPTDARRRWALGLSTATMLTQLGTAIHLAPDYLLAGRQFGTFYYSQFAGPAVNHCQGQPFAIREINRLITEEGGPRVAHILRSCLGVMEHALDYGPIKSLVPITSYPVGGEKKRHFLLIPGSYDYDNLGVGEQEHFTKMKETLTKDCRRAGERHVDYDLWLCPPR